MFLLPETALRFDERLFAGITGKRARVRQRGIIVILADDGSDSAVRSRLSFRRKGSFRMTEAGLEMMNKQNNRCVSERSALFRQLNEVSFAMDELRLYLDIHPDCCEALKLFRTYQEQRQALLKAYTDQYGSIDAYDVNTENGWSWIDGPMPWEGALN